jgi:hypothetical protein
VQALERWQKNGTQAFLKQALVLRVSSPGVLKALQHSSAGRFLGDPLGPTAITVKPNAVEKVQAALVELGYLAEDTSN